MSANLMAFSVLQYRVSAILSILRISVSSFTIVHRLENRVLLFALLVEQQGFVSSAGLDHFPPALFAFVNAIFVMATIFTNRHVPPPLFHNLPIV